MRFAVGFAKILKTLLVQITSFFGKFCHRVFPKRVFLNIIRMFIIIRFL